MYQKTWTAIDVPDEPAVATLEGSSIVRLECSRARQKEREICLAAVDTKLAAVGMKASAALKHLTKRLHHAHTELYELTRHYTGIRATNEVLKSLVRDKQAKSEEQTRRYATSLLEAHTKSSAAELKATMLVRKSEAGAASLTSAEQTIVQLTAAGVRDRAVHAAALSRRSREVDRLKAKAKISASAHAVALSRCSHESERLKAKGRTRASAHAAALSRCSHEADRLKTDIRTGTLSHAREVDRLKAEARTGASTRGATLVRQGRDVERLKAEIRTITSAHAKEIAHHLSEASLLRAEARADALRHSTAISQHTHEVEQLKAKVHEGATAHGTAYSNHSAEVDSLRAEARTLASAHTAAAASHAHEVDHLKAEIRANAAAHAAAASCHAHEVERLEARQSRNDSKDTASTEADRHANGAVLRRMSEEIERLKAAAQTSAEAHSIATARLSQDTDRARAEARTGAEVHIISEARLSRDVDRLTAEARASAEAQNSTTTRLTRAVDQLEAEARRSAEAHHTVLTQHAQEVGRLKAETGTLHGKLVASIAEREELTSQRAELDRGEGVAGKERVIQEREHAASVDQLRQELSLSVASRVKLENQLHETKRAIAATKAQHSPDQLDDEEAFEFFATAWDSGGGDLSREVELLHSRIMKTQSQLRRYKTESAILATTVEEARATAEELVRQKESHRAALVEWYNHVDAQSELSRAESGEEADKELAREVRKLRASGLDAEIELQRYRRECATLAALAEEIRATTVKQLGQKDKSIAALVDCYRAPNSEAVDGDEEKDTAEEPS